MHAGPDYSKGSVLCCMLSLGEGSATYEVAEADRTLGGCGQKWGAIPGALVEGGVVKHR